MTARSVVLFAAIAAASTLASSAAGGEPRSASGRGGVQWRDEWPRFSAWEGATTLAATGGVWIAERRVPDPDHARVDFEVPLLDPGARWLLRGRTRNVQAAFRTYSDLGFRTMAFFPYVVDVGFASLALHRNPDVAAQLFLIDAQALTLSGATQLLVSRLVARQRPYVQDCVDGRTFSKECGSGNDFKSFFSGHSAGAFASAGLVCLHHQHLPLFGGGPIETWACAWAIGVATLTGVGRIVYDAHYASDVLVGAGVGLLYGYVMPRLMHFRDGKLATSGAARPLRRWTPSFAPVADGGVLSLAATF